MIDTRDLAEKREELQTDLVDSFNSEFEKIKDVESFEELLEILQDDDFDLEWWKEDNSDDFEHIEEIEEIESKISEFFNGETLIPEDDFTEYCRDMVEDCYDLSTVPEFIKDNIDWDGVASDLSVDYSEIEYQGKIYLYRD